MTITNIKKDEEKIVLTLDGEEKLIGTYYYQNKNIEEIKYGELVKIEGDLKIPNENTVPHAFNYRKYLKRKGINYTLSIKSIKVIKKEQGLYKIKNFINDTIENIDDSGYMKAFILGDKSLIDDDVYNNYQSIGITHLFAISGMHIGFLSEILIKLLKKLNTVLKYIIIDAFLICYGFIVCFPSSVLRCIVFYILNSINKIFKLELSNKQILLLTIAILIIINPLIIYDVGFLYSVCTVSGILFCSSFINDDNLIRSSFKLSLVAFLFSLPINLYNFYEFNLLSIFYNMIFIPFITIIVYPLSLLSLLIPLLSKIFIFCIKILENSSNLLASFNIFKIYMSFNISEIIVFYLFLYFIFIKRRKIFWLFLLLVIIGDYITPYFDNTNYVYFLDVGQGDSTLIVKNNRKKVILIDTGGIYDSSYHISDNYVSLIKYLGIKRIDYLILTHGDYDHMGEAINIVNKFNVDKVIFNCGELNDLENDFIKVLDRKKIKYYSCIKELNIDKNKLYFLQTKEYDNENDNSNVIYTHINGYRFMFMGDASSTTEREILNKYDLQNVDILKVGHHGSRTSSSKDFINKINPKYSVISVGKKNKYGHPNKEVLENLEDSKIYRTDEDGSIMFKIKNNELSIETCSP